MLKRFRVLSDLLYCFRHSGLFFTNSKIILKFSQYFGFIKETPNGYFSQEGQDVIADDLLKELSLKHSSLRIVDIGANHPSILNNTLYFENQYKAEIFSIEPNPSFIPIYNREGRVLYNFAVGNVEGKLALYVPERILSENYDDNVHASLIKSELPSSIFNQYREVFVDVKRLESIIKPGKYQLLFIDVEGFEMQVLEGIDFSKFSFDIIFVENNSKQRRLNKVRNHLKNLGYDFYGRIHGLDDIFIKGL